MLQPALDGQYVGGLQCVALPLIEIVTSHWVGPVCLVQNASSETFHSGLQGAYAQRCLRIS